MADEGKGAPGIAAGALRGSGSAKPGLRLWLLLGVVGLVLLVAAVLLVLVSVRVAAAEEKRLPVPAVSIRAGELIRDDMVTERAFAPNVLGVAMFIEARQMLVGRMARRALLPGRYELQARPRLGHRAGRTVAAFLIVREPVHVPGS